jgi:hypothetical protein
MLLNKPTLSLAVSVLLAATSLAQTNFPEVEPNSVKAEATAVLNIVPGDTLSGTTTGIGAVAGDTALTTGDTFRVKTAPLPLGIYKHRLTLTTATTTGHTGTLRGLNQTGTAGTASTGGSAGTTDTTIQTTSTTTTPPRFNQWYGFGKAEELYYRVNGTTATTAAYTATFSTSTVPFTAIAVPFESTNPITITTIGVTSNDTEIFVFDANLDALPGFSNDDDGPNGVGGLQSELTRTFAPGTYYVAVTSFNSAWNHVSPPDDDIFAASPLMDFPGSLVRSSSGTTALDWDFAISASNVGWVQAGPLAAGAPYDILWFQFTAMVGAPVFAPPNDNCAAAFNIGTGGTVIGTVAGATNDGAASCDPGGAASRDVWFSYTNANASPRLLTATTCGTASVNDTVVSIYTACGGTELACSDDCGGTPCGGPTSCASVAVAPSQTVIIRVSDKGLGGVGGFGLFTTSVALPPSNDDCSTPIVLAGPGSYGFDTSAATTGTQGQGATPACTTTTSVKNDMWYTYTAGVTGNVTFSTCGLTTSSSTDTKISYFAGAGCPAVSAPIGCDDDLCTSPTLNSILTFAVTCGQVYAIQLGNHTEGADIFGTFSVAESGTTCSTPSTSFCLGDGTGSPCPCGNNSTTLGSGCGTTGSPGGATLSSSGIASDETVSGPTADTLVLTATGLTGPGLFFQANAAPGVINFGDGHLCASTGIQRMGVVFPAGGVASYPGGSTPAEIHLFGNSAGQTKFYQCWYRSSPALCNPGVQNFALTQALSLAWQN